MGLFVPPGVLGGADSLLTGLVAWWKLDETSGTRVNAHNPGTHDLTDNNTVGYTAGKVGNAAAFVAASNEYLSVASHADLQMGDRDFAIAMWVNFASTSETSTIFLRKGGNFTTANEWAMFRVAGQANSVFRVRNAANTANVEVSAISTPYDAWNLLIAEHDAANDIISFSVNNGTPGTKSISGGSRVATYTLLCGGTGGGDDMNGSADEVAIWHRLLTAGEKTRLYNSGAGMAYPG